MTFNCSIAHIVGKGNQITDACSRILKYLGVSTTEDNGIPHGVDLATIRPLQEITSNYINFSNHSTTSAVTSDHLWSNVPPRKDINFTHVDYNFDKCRNRAKAAGHYHNCPHLDKEDMKLTQEDDCKVIKQKNKKVSLDEQLLSSMPEECFEKYTAPSTNINLTDRYNNL